jgi:hypothetical protein
MRTPSVMFWWLAVLGLSCAAPAGSSDAAADAGPTDAGSLDGGAVDAGLPDAGVVDAGWWPTTIVAASANGANLSQWAVAATGNVPPIKTMTVTGEGIFGFAVAPSGALVLARGHTGIEVYDAWGTGAPAPTRVIAGPNFLGSIATGIVAVAVDEAGRIFAARCNDLGGVEAQYEILVFSANASGDAVPVQIISPLATSQLMQISLALHGTELFVGTTDVLVFPTTANGAAAPTRTLTVGRGVTQLAFDASGQRLLVAATNEVLEFDASAQGAATPLRTLQGAVTQIDQAAGVAVAPDGTVFVSSTQQSGTPAILAFDATATGNVAPLRSITGPNAALAFSGRFAGSLQLH